MLISNKSKETIDACRFCWMCRHVCPIGNVTGRERNNARARALSLSMVERGLELTPDIVDNLYECALCAACTKECVTGWDPIEFTKETRLEAALNGLMPEYIGKLVDNIEVTGNPYGISELSVDLKEEILALPEKSSVLLFLGVDARYVNIKSAINAIKLLKKANVNFTVLLEEPDSGYMLDTLLGRAEETRQAMTEAAKQLQYETIVTLDPADAKVFLREYKEWDIEVGAEIRTMTSYINDLIKSGDLKPVKSETIFVFQDPAVLSRDLEEVEEARGILSHCGEVKEMLLYGKDTVWAGNLLMNEYMPNVIEMTAKVRWEDARRTNANVLVTASPSEHEVLAKVKPEDMELSSIEEIVLNACL